MHTIFVPKWFLRFLIELFLGLKFPQHNFTVDKYVFDPTPVPKMLQAGMYKVHVLIMDEEQLVAGLEVIVKLS